MSNASSHEILIRSVERDGARRILQASEATRLEWARILGLSSVSELRDHCLALEVTLSLRAEEMVDLCSVWKCGMSALTDPLGLGSALAKKCDENSVHSIFVESSLAGLLDSLNRFEPLTFRRSWHLPNRVTCKLARAIPSQPWYLICVV
jgi:hypothetical protein